MPFTAVILGNQENITNSNCSDGVQWIYHILNDCVTDGKGIASEVLGLASLFTWMLVSIPYVLFFFILFFLAFNFCRFCVVIQFFHPRHNGQWPPTSKDF